MQFGNPFLYNLKDSKNVLLCGCGGGFDFMHAFPIWQYLVAKNKKVVYGNLSFTTPNGNGLKKVKKITKCCFEVTKDSPQCSFHRRYFPEKYMCQFMEDNLKVKDQKIYIWPRQVTIKDLHEAYAKLVKIHDIDTIVLIDGGSDSLQRGDEETLADVEEDATSVGACAMVKAVKDENKFVCFLGFGIDKYNGVNGSLMLENISNLITKGGYLGTFSLLKEQKEYQMYRKALTYVQEKCDFESVVSHSVVDATDGNFGNFHSTQRTRGGKLFINPLMSIYFCFRASVVAKENYFIKEYHQTKKKESHELGVYLWNFRLRAKENDKIRKNMDFPH